MSGFVLNRQYALELPTSYVDIDNEEMEYIDGGYWFNKSRTFVAWVADAVITLCFAAYKSFKTVASFLSNKGKTSGTQVIVKIATKVGVAKDVANNFASAFSAILGFSIGYGIAYLADYFDKSGLNGHVQF